MNREETIRIIRVISGACPYFKPNSINDMVDAWEMMFAEYPFDVVAAAVKTFLATDKKGYAPGVGQIIEIINRLSEKASGDTITETQAWDMVYKAAERGTYHAEEDFLKMPEIVQKAVGSPNVIREMACDPNFNFGVEQSNFFRAFRREKENTEFMRSMPQEIRKLIGGTANGMERIGNSGIVQECETPGQTGSNNSPTE